METSSSAAFAEVLAYMDELELPVEDHDPGDILGADNYFPDEDE